MREIDGQNDATDPLAAPQRGGRCHRRGFMAGAGAALLALASGCAATRPSRIALPARHTIQSDQLVVVSDFKLPKDHPLIRDLKQLRRDVSDTFELPLGTKDVTVYLFANELQYTQYLQATFPGYPPRRAYFIQTPGKSLAVYTWWGDRIQEDLRHEYTHGLLHAGLEAVPLWLDEGIAEYFEVAGGPPGKVNTEHAQALATSLNGGWRPDLDRLETLEKVEQMHRPDYREAWAWVHYMLHASPDTRQVLLNYVQDLRTTAHPGSLRTRLASQVPDCDGRLLAYVAGLNGIGGWLGSSPRATDSAVRAANY
ncbi:MAG: hypothetical protein ACT4QC_17245 [Planctomycetaceae bacterium]